MGSFFLASHGRRKRAFAAAATAMAMALLSGWAQASMGLSTIAATSTDGPVTLYYPSSSPATPTQRGPFSLLVAEQGVPVRGNGRLVVISHGSGGAPWVHADLAHRLTEAGFVVAMPQHQADNYQDGSNPGPDSWALRPAEVSRAIDSVGRDARFGPLLALDKVGVFGFSAGGHTALSLAGGRWSPGNFKRHCQANLEADFQSCVGLITRLRGNVLDGIKKWAALAVIRHRFDDDTVHADSDARVAAVVAAGPSSADFDMDSFAAPRVPLGLVTLQNDHWLIPRFHSDRVLAACKPCEHIVDVPLAGHGAMLSPLPPGFTGLEADLLNDPPGFDRGQMHGVDEKITAFFVRHLPVPPQQVVSQSH